MNRSDFNLGQDQPRIEGGQAAALRDAKKVSDLSKCYDLNNPDVAMEVYEKMVADPYYFETSTGKQFLRELLRTAIHSEQYLSNEATISGRYLSTKPEFKENIESKAKKKSIRMKEAKKKTKVFIGKDKKLRAKKERTKAYLMKKWVLLLLLAIMIGIFGFNLYEMMDYEMKSYQSAKKIEELISCILEPVDVVVAKENRIADLIASGIDPELIHEVDNLNKEDLSGQVMTVLHQYSQLYKRNPDMAGWIRIEDTIINYPVMLTKDEEEYYLRRDFDRNSDLNGLPFMDASCDIQTPTTNYLIHGHNMKNGAMFSKLLNYEEEEFYQTHKSIVFDTIYEEGIYDIVAVFQTRVAYQDEDVFRYYGMIQAENENDFMNYVKEIKNMSIYDTGVMVSYGDQLLTLSTCDRRIDNGRFVVVARRRN